MKKHKLRGMIMECLTAEGKTSQVRQEMTSWTKEYQSYMTNFKSYIEFKEEHPYAKKDTSYERAVTPTLTKQGQVVSNYESRANSIVSKYCTSTQKPLLPLLARSNNSCDALNVISTS